MNADNDHTELFEKYLEERLNDREVKEFEARLLIDPDFGAAFRLHKELDTALMQEEIMLFRAELELLLANQEDEEWEAPMMLSKAESDLLDEAILDQDVMSLRDQLGQIHVELESELENEHIPKYAGIERAVADQDSSLLHGELEKFDSDILLNAELTDEEVLEEEIDLAIMQTDVMELRAKLENVAAELMPETKVIPMSTKIRRAVSIAAVVMVLLASGIASMNLAGTDHQINREMKSVVKDMVDPGAARGIEIDADLTMSKAYHNFINGKYDQAILLYEALDDMGEGKPETWIYLGRSYHNKNNYELATIAFEKIVADNNSTFTEMADILLFDCLRKLDRNDEAIARLEAILKQEGHQYKSNAQKCLNMMK